MYKINWHGLEMTITREFALAVVESMGIHTNTEEAPTVEEPKERITDEAQTTLTHYVAFRAPHATGWRSHCSRCGSEGRKCLSRLNHRCWDCVETEWMRGDAV